MSFILNYFVTVLVTYGICLFSLLVLLWCFLSSADVATSRNLGKLLVSSIQICLHPKSQWTSNSSLTTCNRQHAEYAAQCTLLQNHLSMWQIMVTCYYKINSLELKYISWRCGFYSYTHFWHKITPHLLQISVGLRVRSVSMETAKPEPKVQSLYFSWKQVNWYRKNDLVYIYKALRIITALLPHVEAQEKASSI